jgi:hypothetical protein
MVFASRREFYREMHEPAWRPPKCPPRLAPGQKVQVGVNYSDGTVNLNSCVYGVRNGQLEEAFPIEH